MKNSENEIRGDNCPRNKRRGFVKIVDGALFEIESAQKHRGRVKQKCDEQNKIIHAVVRAKTFSPQKNRIGGTQAVKNHGEQKEMPVGEPRHEIKLIQENRSAKVN